MHVSLCQINPRLTILAVPECVQKDKLHICSAFCIHWVSEFWQICSRIYSSYKLILFKLICSTFKLSQNLVSILCNKDGVLMLSGKTAIFGNNSPSVPPLIPLGVAVHKYRLYGECLPHLHLIPRSVSGWRYRRIGMEMSTHSMAYEVWTYLHSMPICYTVYTLQVQQCKRPRRAVPRNVFSYISRPSGATRALLYLLE